MNGQKKKIHLAVTNGLAFDQRMTRICTSLHQAGYEVCLVGIQTSHPPPHRPYQQVRLSCWFKKGKLFYLENHLRLFFFLLFQRTDLLVANDLDTALPVWLASTFKNVPRLMDAHEYYTEMKEVMSRPMIFKIWSALANFLIPRFPIGYTVGPLIGKKLKDAYGVHYGIVRNVPVKRPLLERNESSNPFLLYQGAVNEGRGFEILIPAMKHIPYRLVICGDGNYMDKLKKLIQSENVSERVQLTGMITPDALRKYAMEASLGVFLPEQEGSNQYLALPNKFWDNMEAGLPQIAFRYPEYEQINKEFPIALLLDERDPKSIAESICKLMVDAEKRAEMTNACRQAREKYCWQNEEYRLLTVYNQIFGS
ncbi:MAG: hypothetical protein RLZZ256_1313 [Bacteroidota bacterium]